MPWMPVNIMSIRSEFVLLTLQDNCNFKALCQRFGISTKTGYKWRQRYLDTPQEGFQDRSRRPKSSPTLTTAEIEALVVDLRQKHPVWGGRKRHRRLLELGHVDVPAPSTITNILHRHGLICAKASEQAQHWLRFEHDQPNALWQIDFKGNFNTAQQMCFPLTLLDDHSRFNLTLTACGQTTAAIVQTHLTDVFLRYGLPARINADNGSPWGSPSDASHGISQLSIWLIRLGIHVSHSRPGHPQTNGKEERFHRTLKAEVLNGRAFRDLAHVQHAFNDWRTVYNEQRPHEALGLATPITRYKPSLIAMPSALPEIEYGPNDQVITVGWGGEVKLQNHKFKVSSALHRLPIALRADSLNDGVFDLYFCHQHFGRIDLNTLQLNN
ncbi:Integrase core domain [Iodobacter fluviatilis]|uniref:Integrase core domain n=1 Tax=Iodobacter fluviatilis TaxID=537 RepID=A0A377Q2L6_9NEIS|nr:IS481 family transposase [Iodobacter fluviatilis]STQ89008.1 Integrase core domain [Iodobacter fluviatilis]